MDLPHLDRKENAGKLHVVVVDKNRKSALVIDIAIPSKRKIRKKEYEKLEKY